MDSFHQLPGEGAEEQVMEEDSDGGAHSVVTGDQGTIHAHQEQCLSQDQGYGQLTMDGMELLSLGL